MTDNGQLALVMAIGALAGGILQAGALFFWAGKITQKSNDHDRRLGDLEDSQDEETKRRLRQLENSKAKGASA